MQNATSSNFIFFGVHLADWLATAILLATIFGIFLGPYFAGWLDRRHRKRNACKALIEELDDTRIALTTNKHTTTESKKDNIYYKDAFLNEEAYTSITHSGIFTEFIPTTQNTLSNFYANLKLRNQLLTRITNFNEIFFLHDDSPSRYSKYREAVKPYQKSVTSYETYLKNNLELLDKVLRKETPRSALEMMKQFGRLKGTLIIF